jgi:hypothetical protein
MCKSWYRVSFSIVDVPIRLYENITLLAIRLYISVQPLYAIPLPCACYVAHVNTNVLGTNVLTLCV